MTQTENKKEYFIDAVTEEVKKKLDQLGIIHDEIDTLKSVWSIVFCTEEQCDQLKELGIEFIKDDMVLTKCKY